MDDQQYNHPRVLALQERNMSLDELSDTLENIVSSPDINCYINAPGVAHEPMSEDTPESQNVVMQPIKEEIINESLDQDQQMQNPFKANLNDPSHIGYTKDTRAQNEQKMIKKITPNNFNLIKGYCSRCKVLVNNSSDVTCAFCQAKLLYQCNNCKSIFKKLINCQQHVRTECLRDSIFSCGQCSYVSTAKLQLLKHIQNDHTTNLDTVFACAKCNKCFRKQQNVLAHEKICGLEPILQCKYCPYKSHSNNGLTTHVRMKHPERMSQNHHTCPECGKKYKTIATLNRHVKTCGKIFKYICDHCEYKVNRKFNLEQHMRKVHPALYFSTKFKQTNYSNSTVTTSTVTSSSATSSTAPFSTATASVAPNNSGTTTGNTLFSEEQLKLFIYNAVDKYLKSRIDV